VFKFNLTLPNTTHTPRKTQSLHQRCFRSVSWLHPGLEAPSFTTSWSYFSAQELRLQEAPF